MSEESRKATILVIDDEAGTRIALDMILKDNYRVLKAESAQEGLSFIKEQKVDLVMTDIHMPDMTGIDLLRQVKQLDPTLEVVMVTGYANLDTAKAALRLGALEYINKPFDYGHIREIVREGVEKHRRAQETIRNIENLRQEKEGLERELMISERLVNAGQLTTGVIHEMNNPLTIIQGYVEILMKKLKNGGLSQKESEEYNEYLGTVEKQVQQCRDIAVGFLSFVREQKVETHPLQLNLMLEELAALFKMQEMARKVKITVHGDPNLPEIPLSVALVRQVLVNLMVNAIHAMPQGGSLDLRTEDKPECVEVRISDTGTGISPENLKKMFQVLFTTKEGGKGSGLGLAISKKIVEKHGGTISVASELGKGTIFTLQFPKQVSKETSLKHAKGAA